MMRRPISLLLCGACAAAFSFGAAARGPGGGAPGGHGASAPGGGPPARSQAWENSNGRFVQDREFGLDRAAERRSDQGNEHEKATDAQKKRRKSGPGELSAGSTK
jgi:hypothetical protein